ncbi:hypothetical protein [Arcobacter defluvii]|uniref:Uncharacterized protein n=1 Tax=Arcobacter defluvii TaxID=873191 RepID=A0AAE7BHI5_9BACT|nr:hypothetical protein [Arcobacter defluvii]QKF77289.1 hypothetical protein ADFLV_1257 [Arcobacter defluvii]QKF77867.1 hypothetical protein ADFLV_1849 [Arcobacter defluvii]RXI29658.1 hypothetical protein CP964_13505 [Arcobacter defluvii]
MIKNIELSLSLRSLEILIEALVGEISFLSFQQIGEDKKNIINEYNEVLNELKNLEKNQLKEKLWQQLQEV